ncbi:hypothetical protein K5549_013478 [Capra hircus]|nr:hypothetical protein K5549_013478 [Capra hircus]
MWPLPTLPKTHHFCPPQLSLDPLGPEWDCPLGSKDLEEEEGPWGGGSGLPPRGCFPGSWRHDVGLDCKGAPEGAASSWDPGLLPCFICFLYQAATEESVDRDFTARIGCPGAEVTLCILGSPSTFLSVLLEAGVQSPGNMLLCLSPAWLTKVPAPGQPGEAALLVSKAVSFHPGGLTFLDDFVPPRRATYFLAGLGLGPGWGREAAELARDLTCPTGASAEDRLLTRRLLAQQGNVAVPATLAFTYKPPALLRGGDTSPGLRMVELNGKEGQETLVKEEVGAFLHSEALGDALQVAVKLSGWRWRGRQALRLYPRAEQDPVVDTVLALLEKLEEEESVLVEAVCPPARLPFPGSPPPGPELALRICAVVCRTQGDRPLLSKVVCSVGRGDRPLRHQSSLPRTLEAALAQCVLTLEAGLSAEQRGGRQVRTDFLGPGVDFALTVAGRALTPVALALNGGLCLEACGALEGLWAAQRPGLAAEEAAAAPLVETMLRRSARCLMEGKQLLLLGAGGVSKKFVWEAARDYGLKLHLVESDPNHFASQLVQTFIHFDVTEHRRDEENARALAELVRARGLQLDGCFSYWDDCLVLTALLCQELGLPCSPPAAMRLAKQKSRTQLHLLCRRGPPWPVPLPGVMKLEFGAGAVGVRLVKDASQCHEHFSRIARDLQGEADHPGIGLGWGNAMLLMEFIEGTEHDVDLVLFGGRLLAAFVSDNGPTRLPGFTETAACMPTGLAPEQEAQLVQAAFRCCLGCGLLDGVFNVELKLTGAGPRLIEINPRMGGFYLRDWILELYGVDLLLAAAMALVPGEYEEPYCSVACAGSSPAEARHRLLGLCQGLGIDGPHYPVAYFLSHFK